MKVFLKQISLSGAVALALLVAGCGQTQKPMVADDPPTVAEQKAQLQTRIEANEAQLKTFTDNPEIPADEKAKTIPGLQAEQAQLRADMEKLK